jgi:hypothetical protein
VAPSESRSSGDPISRSITRAFLQDLPRRNWSTVRDTWIPYLPTGSTSQKPVPGLEKLPPLLDLEITGSVTKFGDVPGLRSNALAEAIYLYHKAAHVKASSESLSNEGLQSWSMFNAYHCAYLAAKSVLALFGISIVYLKRQVVIDLFPEAPAPTSRKRPVGQPESSEFAILPVTRLDQQDIWLILKRMVNVTTVPCWDQRLTKQVKKLDETKITPPRNHFLYKAIYWPLEDLIAPLTFNADRFLGEGLDESTDGFLLTLAFAIFKLLEDLLTDLATASENTLPTLLKGAIDTSLWIDSTPYKSFCEKFIEESQVSHT